MIIRFSVGKNTFDNMPVNQEAESFFAFGKYVLGARSQKKGETYITAPFNGDGRRKREGALPRAWLPFDFDMIADGEAFADLCMFLSRYVGFGYTTASHTSEKPRARAILAADREMTREECRRVCLAIDQKIRDALGDRVGLDASVYRAEQPVYTPLIGAQSFVWKDGEVVDVDETLKDAPELEQERTSAQRIDEASLSDPVLKHLQDKRMVLKDLGNGRFGIVCPCSDQHTSASGDTSTVYMLPNFGGVKYGKFHCLHSHCENRSQEEFLAALGLDSKAVWGKQRGEEKKEEQRKLPRIQSIDATDLIQQQFRPIKWAVPGIIPEGVTLLAGAPKIGKSWAALDISVAVVCGGMVFGSIQVDPGEVLYLALEDNARRMKSRVTKALRGESIPKGLHLAYSAPRVDEGLIEALVEFLAEHPAVRLIIVDTIKPIRPVEKKTDRIYDADYSVGRPFLALASTFNISVLLVHHTNKSKSEDELDTVSGSTGLAGGVDNVLVLKRARASSDAVLYVTGRDIEHEGRFGLWWDQDNAAWLMNEDGPRVAMSPERKAVFDIIKNVGPIAARSIAGVLHPGVPITRESKEWMRVRFLVGKLKREGLVEMNSDNEFVIKDTRNTRYTAHEF